MRSGYGQSGRGRELIRLKDILRSSLIHLQVDRRSPELRNLRSAGDFGCPAGRGLGRQSYARWTGMPVSETLTGQPGEAASQRLRRRALLVSGMGFFTDAYDLFVIGIVSTLLKTQWHLGTSQLALLNAVMLGAAFLGAIVFGRLADKIGRTRSTGCPPRSW
jgi:hypothetical protein